MQQIKNRFVVTSSVFTRKGERKVWVTLAAYWNEPRSCDERFPTSELCCSSQKEQSSISDANAAAASWNILLVGHRKQRLQRRWTFSKARSKPLNEEQKVNVCVERVGWLMVQGKKNQLKQLLLLLRLTFPLLSLPGHTLSADGIRRIATFDECFVGLFFAGF